MTDFRDTLEEHVSRWVNKNIRDIGAYKVPDSTGMVKLDAMENPFVWPEKMQNDWAQLMSSAHVNRYPHPDAPEVKSGIRKVFTVPEHIDVLLGNGSDELIQLIAMAVNGDNRKVLAPEPSFVMYEMVSKFVGMEYIGVTLTDDFEIDLEAMLRTIEVENPAVVFLAQPNNPTGNLWGDEKLKRILETANGLVVIDEAYTAFTDADYMSWLEEFPNLLIMRTFSKVGLAGLRLGMLFGHTAWIEQINKLRLPYNINSLTQTTAVFALEHYDVLKTQTEELVRQRKKLALALSEFTSLKVYPSEANFLLVRTEENLAQDIHEQLKEKGVLVKKLDGAHPLLKDCLRINASSSDEMDQLIVALKTILS
jgi:histidinol-phosphate aminotransferase